jgi:rhodanese-related sulfurtransferase
MSTPRTTEIRIMSREELKEKLDRGDRFKLYMTLDRRAFDQSHIPGSLHLHDMAEVAASLKPDEEIVVYCANPACTSSINAYRRLRRWGFTNLYRYAGGLEEWRNAGYPLVGEGEPETMYSDRSESSE